MSLRDGLRALMARDRAVENWLHNQAGPAYDALKADPSRAVTAGEVRARLAAEHTKTVKRPCTGLEVDTSASLRPEKP